MSDSQLTTDPGYQTLVDRISAIYAEGQLQAHRAVFSTNGAAHVSPGQRPGYASSFNQALKGRPNRCLAPFGLRKKAAKPVPPMAKPCSPPSPEHHNNRSWHHEYRWGKDAAPRR
jgi:hypothetical protein